MAKYNTLKALFTAIANSLRSKTGGSGKIVADDFPSVIDGLSTGGITPSGTKNITSNGTHDVTSYANASVNVPVPDGYIKPSGTKSITSNGTHDVTNYASAQINVPVGITPSGTKTITENGTFDVTSFANALVNVQGINARIFTSTVSADATSGSPTIAAANDWIASIRSNANAFVIVRYLGAKASTAMMTFWFAANFAIVYGGGSTTAYNTILVQQSTTYQNQTFNVKGLTGDNYSGHLCVASNGRLYCYPNATYPLKAGTYQIIAGTLEAL